MTVRDLPALNAVLNATSAILLVIGLALIRASRIALHRRVMTAAFATSTLFLISYLTYHAQVGSVRFTGTGRVRTIYFAILIAASGPVTRWITDVRIRRRMDRITGLILIGFGARLAIEP